MTPEQMARLVAGDFDCHDYVEINVGGTGPNEADFETLDTPGVVIRGLATELITLQQEKAALLAERDSARNVCLEWDTLRLEQEVKEKDEVIWACRADGADLLADNRRLRAALEATRGIVSRLYAMSVDDGVEQRAVLATIDDALTPTPEGPS